MSRRSVAVNLLVFVLIVYGVAFLFSNRFPGLLPQGFSSLEDITPLEAPTEIAGEQFADPVEPDPADPESTGEPNLLGRIFLFFEPIAFFAGSLIEAVNGAVAGAIATVSISFASILDPLISVASFNLPALSENIVGEFLRLAVVGVVLLTLAFLIFGIVRSVIPFLPG